MRIGIDGRFVSLRYPGVGRYCYNLVRGLGELPGDETYVVYRHVPSWDPRFDLATWDGCPRIVMRALPHTPRSPRDQWEMGRVLVRDGVDLFHAPFPLRAYLLPVPAVTTVHDLIPLLFPRDLPSPLIALGLRLAITLAVRRSIRVLTDSRASADDLSTLFPGCAPRLRVTSAAADPSFTPRPRAEIEAYRHARALPVRFFLTVGSNKPHKNLSLLLDAYALYRARRGADPAELVLAGPVDPRYEQVTDAAARPGVRSLGLVPEAELPLLYGAARGLLLPSRYEGFGLSLIEALSCGTPTVCSTAPALQEIGADVCLFADPTRADEWADRLVRLDGDEPLRQRLSIGGRQRASAYSWRRTAELTLAAYRSCR